MLAELEACSFRNKTPAETAAHMKPLLDKYLPLSASSPSASTSTPAIQAERQKDHYSHFILRLAFARTEDLRRRFSRAESSLFRLRFANDDLKERQLFVDGLGLDWESVGEDERREFADEVFELPPLLYSSHGVLFRPWDIVPDLRFSRQGR